ncbi:transglycosylase-like protein with SLT domain [Streptomyces sp. TLI_146]|nr:transglycosylase-like protein with SLT domain [Streptomyces sp. TLI_146]
MCAHGFSGPTSVHLTRFESRPLFIHLMLEGTPVMPAFTSALTCLPARLRVMSAAGTVAIAATAALTLTTASPATAAPRPASKAQVSSPTMDQWIGRALAIMKAKHIPGSYAGILRNIKRESGGNPRAVNNWDSNARAGTPSKGLLQVIDPTFRRFHVAGTAWDIFDPVANIAAACNYAAHTYGSIDNVNSGY